MLLRQYSHSLTGCSCSLGHAQRAPRLLLGCVGSSTAAATATVTAAQQEQQADSQQLQQPTAGQQPASSSAAAAANAGRKPGRPPRPPGPPRPPRRASTAIQLQSASPQAATDGAAATTAATAAAAAAAVPASQAAAATAAAATAAAAAEPQSRIAAEVDSVTQAATDPTPTEMAATQAAAAAAAGPVRQPGAPPKRPGPPRPPRRAATATQLQSAAPEAATDVAIATAAAAVPASQAAAATAASAEPQSRTGDVITATQAATDPTPTGVAATPAAAAAVPQATPGSTEAAAAADGMAPSVSAAPAAPAAVPVRRPGAPPKRPGPPRPPGMRRSVTSAQQPQQTAPSPAAATAATTALAPAPVTADVQQVHMQLPAAQLEQPLAPVQQQQQQQQQAPQQVPHIQQQSPPQQQVPQQELTTQQQQQQPSRMQSGPVSRRAAWSKLLREHQQRQKQQAVQQKQEQQASQQQQAQQWGQQLGSPDTHVSTNHATSSPAAETSSVISNSTSTTFSNDSNSSSSSSTASLGAADITVSQPADIGLHDAAAAPDLSSSTARAIAGQAAGAAAAAGAEVTSPGGVTAAADEGSSADAPGTASASLQASSADAPAANNSMPVDVAAVTLPEAAHSNSSSSNGGSSESGPSPDGAAAAALDGTAVDFTSSSGGIDSSGSDSDGDSSSAAARQRSRTQARAARAATAADEPAASTSGVSTADSVDTPLSGPTAAAAAGVAASPAPAAAVEVSPAAAVEASPAVARTPTASAAAVEVLPATAEPSLTAAAEASPATAVPAAAAPAGASPAAPAAAAAATAPALRRLASGVTGSKSPGGTGISASALGQILAGQRKLAAPTRKAGGRAGSSSSSRGGSIQLEAPGKIESVNGRWVMKGFEADKQQAGDSLIPALQARLMAGVQSEQEQEQTAIKKLYAASSLRQLQKDGIVLLQLQARPSHVLYSNMVWRFSLASRDLPYHRFRQGDSLLVSRSSEDQLVEVSGANSRSTGMGRAAFDGSHDLRPGSDGFRPLDATVVEVRKDHLLLALEKSESDRIQAELRLAAAAPLVSWRLDQSVRDTTARRQMDAVRRLAEPTTDSPFEQLFRLVLAGTSNGNFASSIPPEWARNGLWRLAARELLKQAPGLNDSQRAAIAKAMTRTFTLWQGPPGTGKTRTLLALVEVLVKAGLAQKAGWTAMGPILACGDTNAAVDNLVEGLLNRKLKVVRLGQPAKVRANLQQHTLEALAAQTPMGRQAEELRKTSKEMFEQSRQLAEGTVLSWSSNRSRTNPDLIRSSRATGRGAEKAQRVSSTAVAGASSEELEKRAKRHWAQAEKLSREAAQQVLREAQVVCATCSGAGDPLLTQLQFNMVVIDEATQATEPATLVPLTQGAQCVVMAGDPAQLPPTVTSREAVQQHQLSVTLFERLQRALGLEPLLLDTQYRMNPHISGFPSHQFYKGKLKDGVTAEQKPAAAGINWPQPQQPVMVLAVQGREEQAKKSKGKGVDGSDLVYAPGASDAAGGLMEASYRNLQEARVVLQAAHALITAGDVATAAILTPYKGQVRAFEHALRVLSPWFTPELLARLTISSVDGYQGREADVVLFSAVRCNEQGRIGFVSDRRRLNVAITRPRRGLVVVCSLETLRKGSQDWAAFLDWSQERRWITSSRVLPAAPWQQEGFDPFSDAALPGQGGTGAGGFSSSSSGSGSGWSTAASEDLT